MLKTAPVPFRIALTMARKSKYKPHKIGACIAKGRRVISAGYNQTDKSHPLIQKLNYSIGFGLHAEQHACIGVHPSYLVGANIYIVRLRANGKIIALAKPCEMCRAYLMQRGIRKIYYSISEEEFGYLRLNKKMGYYEEK
ncbi:MAG: hypothetical protein ACFFBD_07245 [Candidatus Hodarchaeota archaeon]